MSTNPYSINGQFIPPGIAGIQTGVGLTRHTFVAATIANLQGLNIGIRDDGALAFVEAAGGSHWRFDAASAAADTTSTLVLTPTAGTGRWLRTDKTVTTKIAVAFGTADEAVLFTVPVGFTLAVQEAAWEIGTSFTGGSSSAIGLSSSNTNYATQGDILGGAVGSVAAEITSTIKHTATPRGATFTATPFTCVLEAADTVIFDRITSVFTAGAGFVRMTLTQIEA